MRRYVILLLCLALAGCNLPGSSPVETPPPVTLPTQQVLVTPLPPSETGGGGGEPTPAVDFPTPPPPTPELPAAPNAGAPVPTQPAGTIGPYAVIGVARNDTLNIREAAGINTKIVARLNHDTINLWLTGKEQTASGRRWVEVLRPGRPGTGWVNAAYLTEYVAPQVFCADPRAQAVLDQAASAFQKGNGKQLAALVSPLHGLDVTYLRTGSVANYTPEEAQFVFDSTYAMKWGTHPASGAPVTGSFHDLVLPDLLDVLNGKYETICNNPALGGHSYTFEWPPKYRNINFFALYKPGPAGQELAWRTWLVGFEYVKGEPKLFALMHLFWEP
jgi:hypothetical protein